MHRLFPVADSVLVAVAVGAVCVAAVGFVGAESNGYWYALGVAVATLSLVFIVGSRQGRDKVDGVFFGPVVRSFFLLLLTAGIVGWALQPSAPENGSKPDAEGRGSGLSDGLDSDSRRAAQCDEDVDRLEAMLREARERELRQETSLNYVDLEELRGAATTVAYCPGDAATNAHDSFTAFIKARNKSRDAAPPDDHEAIARAIVQRPSQDADLDIGTPIEDEAGPGVVIVLPNMPRGGSGTQQPSEGGSGTGMPSEGGSHEGSVDATNNRATVTKIYRREMRFNILSLLLGALGFGFGTTISVEEIEAGVLASNPENKGKPLHDFLEAKNLGAAARSRIVAHLLRVGAVEEPLDPSFAQGVRAFVTNDLTTGICFSLISRVSGESSFRLATIRPEGLMRAWSLLQQSTRTRIVRDVEVCIRENTDDEAIRQDARKLFRSDRETARED